MVDLDRSGYGFQRVRTYLGPSLGWVDELVKPESHITVGGIYDVLPGESLLLVDATALVQINLPDVRMWVGQRGGAPATALEKSLTVKDLGLNAHNFNISVVPHAQQTIDSIQQEVLITNAGGTLKLLPLIDMTGWLVETTGTGGGATPPGGGDVFKAGNNTFTGTNTFQNTVTVPTATAGDSTQKAASTAYVQSQGFVTGVTLLPYAFIDSQAFTGTPTVPIPTPPNDSSLKIANTAFVQAAIIAAGGGGAPTDASFITFAPESGLPNERVLTASPTITIDVSTAGQIKLNSSAGGGNVSSSGTPATDDIAQWVNPTTIKGIAKASLGFAPIDSPTFTTVAFAPTPTPSSDASTKIATTQFVQTVAAGKQPLDGDLTALAALTGTNTIYYRSGVDTWLPVTYSGITFSGGVLTATGSGGNVSNSGTPTVNQLAQWVTSTTIKGIDISSLGFAPITSPTFLTSAFAPTPTPGSDNSTKIATTAFVQAAVAGAGGGAPVGAPYATFGTDATLTNERVLTDSATITIDLGTAGQIKFNSSAGGGNVSTSGTITTGQYAKWASGTTVQSVSAATVLSDIGAQPLDPQLTALAVSTPSSGDVPYFSDPTTVAYQGSTSYGRALLGKSDGSTVLTYIQGQPLDGDLTAIAALAGTNTIYYRSGSNLWSPVTFSGLSFSGGVLTVTAGGGNVNNSGTPSTGQVAEWTGPTTIQGVTGYAKLASPLFTGTPQSVTMGLGDNSIAIATTAFVKGNLANFLPVAGGSTLTGGFYLTPYNAGSFASGTFTPNAGLGNYQYYNNTGAHTLAAPTADCAIDIMVTNGAGAGAITFSGFTVGANTGDALTTTNTNKFIVSIRRINAVSTYAIKALQ